MKSKLFLTALTALPFAATSAFATATLTADEVASAGAGMSLAAGVVITLVAFCLLPGVIASIRKHPNAIPIWLVTILFGWTIIGWLIALIWSFTAGKQNPTVVTVNMPNNNTPAGRL